MQNDILYKVEKNYAKFVLANLLNKFNPGYYKWDIIKFLEEDIKAS